VLGALGLRDASARPARTALAGLAVALAVVTAIVSAGFIDTVSRLIDDPTAAGEPWDAAVSPTDGTSAVDVVDVLDSTPEVASWFSETSRRSTIGDEAFLSQAIGGEPAAARFDIGAGRAVERSGEAVIGYGMVTRFGLDVGDTVELSAGDVPLTVEVVGWYREMEDSGEILQYRLEQLQRADPAGAGPDTYRVTGAEGVDTESLALVLADRLGGFADVEARETDAAAVEAFVAVLRLVALVIGAVAAVNLLAVMLTSTRESARAIGVEQTLGVTPGQLVGQGAVAAAAIGVVGVVVGLPLGLWLLRLMGDAVTSSMGIGPGYGRLPSPVALTVVAVAAVGVAASLGALAVRRLASRPPADLVRWE
jgi:putative ABC transport system permease protein